MSYVLTAEAAAELAHATSVYKQKFGPAAAENFLDSFEEKIRLIAEFPGVGTASSKGRRVFPLGRYPFSLLYRVEAGVVYISAIAHQRRRPGYWQRRK